jgi:soluble lytic murein transglycosylase-like protein
MADRRRRDSHRDIIQDFSLLLRGQDRLRVRRSKDKIAAAIKHILAEVGKADLERRRMVTLRKMIATGVLALSMFSVHATAFADDNAVCEREMARAAIIHQVPLAVLYAVGLTETGRSGFLKPYSLNIDGQAVIAPDLRGAIQRFQSAERAGAKFIDIGCMQINHQYHAMDFSSLEEMFDPAKNVEYSAAFLKELKAREGSWTMAVARYNAGPNNDVGQKKYICMVIGNMISSGMGGWTANARDFCARHDDPAR